MMPQGYLFQYQGAILHLSAEGECCLAWAHELNSFRVHLVLRTKSYCELDKLGDVGAVPYKIDKNGPSEKSVKRLVEQSVAITKHD